MVLSVPTVSPRLHQVPTVSPLSPYRVHRGSAQGPQGLHGVPGISPMSLQGPHPVPVVPRGSAQGPQGPHHVRTVTSQRPRKVPSVPLVSAQPPSCPQGPPKHPHSVPRVPPNAPTCPRAPPQTSPSVPGVSPCPRRGGLAEAALVARVNGTLQDLDRPLEGDADLELLDFSSPEGRTVSPGVTQRPGCPPTSPMSPMSPPQAFWLSGACVLGAAAQQLFGATFCGARATEDGFFCDVDMGDRYGAPGRRASPAGPVSPACPQHVPSCRTVQGGDLPALEEACVTFARSGHRFERLEATRPQLAQLFQVWPLCPLLSQPLWGPGDTPGWGCGAGGEQGPVSPPLSGTHIVTHLGAPRTVSPPSQCHPSHCHTLQCHLFPFHCPVPPAQCHPPHCPLCHCHLVSPPAQQLPAAAARGRGDVPNGHCVQVGEGPHTGGSSGGPAVSPRCPRVPAGAVPSSTCVPVPSCVTRG